MHITQVACHPRCAPFANGARGKLNGVRFRPPLSSGASPVSRLRGLRYRTRGGRTRHSAPAPIYRAVYFLHTVISSHEPRSAAGLTLGSGTGSRVVGIRAPATATPRDSAHSGGNERTTRGARGILVHLCGLRPRLRLTVWLTPEQSRHQSRLAAGALPTGGAVLRRRASSVCASAGRRAPTACMSLSSRAHV